jgi:hypothetical protein
MSTIAVSSWALHRTLGVTYHDSPASGPKGRDQHAEPELPLLELPRALKEHGFDWLEICHFHVPTRDAGYLHDLKAAIADSGVTLQSVLIDEGDPSHPEHADRDTEWIAGWIDTAAELGAERARVIAGKQPFSQDALDRSVANLLKLARQGAERGVRVTTENWFSLLAGPDAVLQLLDRTEGQIGLCVDFGNWPAPSKYENLPLIMPRGETCHAKCEIGSDMKVDKDDYDRCLAIARATGFDGPYVLVNGGPADEWEALRVSVEAIG